jgi:hypothetical protein
MARKDADRKGGGRRYELGGAEMARYAGFVCKTPRCGTQLGCEEVGDNTERRILVPLRVHPFEDRVTCPVCGQEHVYTQNDLTTFAREEQE